MVYCVEAYTLGMDCSTKVVVEQIAEMVDSLANDDMEGCKAKEDV